MTTLVRAKYVATMTAPGPGPTDNGAVAIADGRILAAGPFDELRDAHAAANIDDLGDALILPGLVNAHTHLELSALDQLSPGGSANFVDWVLELRRRIVAAPEPGALLRSGVHAGVAESLRFGVTTVADITNAPHLTRPILAASPLAGVSFGEVLGMAGRRAQLEPRLAAALDRAAEREHFRAGVEPHAPYSVDLPGIRRCADEARARRVPLAIHLAETPDEAEFLADHAGEFRRLWGALGDWRDDVPTFAGGPVAMARALGLLDQPNLLAHVNYATDADLDLLAAGRATVVYCPRTHAYFGHPPHRFAEMLARGINVAVGTDSRASSPDLDVMADLRLIHRQHPGLPPADVLSLATTRGARALGMEDALGKLTAGRRADLCAYQIGPGPDPLLQLLESDAPPLMTIARGARVP